MSQITYGDSKNEKGDDYDVKAEVLPVSPPVGESQDGWSEHPQPHEGLKRTLKARHMAMLSIGGAIGTGLFLGTSSALSYGGPLGLILGYAAVGSVCWCMMISLGEMISFLPVPGGHIKLAERFVDPSYSFVMGYNYMYSCFVGLPTELSAGATIINMWNDEISNAVWITIGLVLIVTLNVFSARVYGEAEFYFCTIKILAVVGLILLGIILTSGGGPSGEVIGFKYWRDPGAFVQYDDISGSLGRFLGFWAVLMKAAFAYIGTETIAIAAGEAQNPRRNVPRAIKRIYIRILFFYLGSVFIIGLIVASDDSSLSLDSGSALSSPFVIAIKNAGIPVLPSIINACLLTSAWSAASSGLYTSSRTLYGLAIIGQAPRIFARTTKAGVPYMSILVGASFGCLSYMSIQTTASEVFGYFSNMTSAAGLLTWWGICFVYIRFEKGLRAQGIPRSSLPYAPWYNYRASAAWYAIVFISIILFFTSWSVFLKGNWDTANFVTSYLPIWLYPFLWIGAKLYKKTHFKRASEMDFVSGLEEIEADCYEEPVPDTWMAKFCSWLV